MWQDEIEKVEALQDLSLDPDLVQHLERWTRADSARSGAPIQFHTPTFKYFETSELSSCGKNAWPAISITGSACKLQCDHCKARILEPMLPATTPEALWTLVRDIVADGGQGILLTGGSNHRNEVEYGPYLETIRRIKDEYPDFRIAAHAALMDADAAQALAQAGVDVAMMDVIGAQDTITQVYHLKRSVADFEETLANLVQTDMRVVPHIVIGLHYGQILGEWEALNILQRHRPDAVVLVVVMPFYAPARRPFQTPDIGAVGRLFAAARAALPDLPLLLGCARPPGIGRLQIDSYAVMAGLDGIAHPSDGIVELAARLGRRVRVSPACCSMALDAGASSVTGVGLELDLDRILADRRTMHPSPLSGKRVPIPIVAAQ
jgi:uncharacterized radical SAM superfamily protein